MTSWPLFQNILIFRRPGVDIFADIIKIVTMFIETITKDSRKVKRIRNYVSKSNLCVFLDVAKFPDFRWKNADVSRTQGMCHVIYTFFGSSLGKV